MKVKLKKLNENAKLPKQSKEGDFCYDVWATSEGEIAPNVWRYGLGFKYEIERPKLYNTFGGIGAVFEKETDLGWCKEIIDRDAFNKCNMSDCVLKYNHKMLFHLSFYTLHFRN